MLVEQLGHGAAAPLEDQLLDRRQAVDHVAEPDHRGARAVVGGAAVDDVLARGQCIQRHTVMPVLGRRDHDGLYALVVEQPAVVLVRHDAVAAPCVIEGAIIDKNARIGNNVVISPAGKPENLDHPFYSIRDGIVVIPKNGIVPHGTVI